MKKSQILAALALAFALGVVAPVSSASAYVMAGEGKAEVEAGMDTALNKANALTDCSGTNDNTLVEYNVLIGAVNTAAKNVEDATKSAYTNLKTAISNPTFVAKMHDAGTQASNATWTGYNGTEANAYSNYDALSVYANGLADDLQTVFEANPTWTDVKAAADYLRDGSTTSATGAAQNLIDVAENGGKGAINTQLALMGQVTSGNTTYALAVAAAKNMPKYSNFEIVLAEYGVIYTIANSTSAGYRVVTAQKALDQLNADIANFCSTTLGTVEAPKPDTNEPAPAEDDKNTPKPGNTGVVAGADATAKATVSIMAAIASVATAAFVAIRKIAAGKKA